MLLLLLGLATATAAEPSWGPWDGRWAPVGDVEAVPARDASRGGAFEALYRLYRRATRGDTRAGCPYYPTCSAYFILSVREHGPFLGAMLTTDRLLREYPGMENADHYPLVTPHDRARLYDPVPPGRSRDGGRPFDWRNGIGF